MMKMVMIAYNEAIEMEVMETLERCALKNYTKVAGAFGKGTSSGTHHGNDIWPGKNNVLYVACDEKDARALLTCIAALRKTVSREGLKAFLWPLEDLT